MGRLPDKRRAVLRHANRYDTLTWCDARSDWDPKDDGLDVIGSQGPTEDLAEVTCEDCLSEIAEYGRAAGRRQAALARSRR